MVKALLLSEAMEVKKFWCPLCKAEPGHPCREVVVKDGVPAHTDLQNSYHAERFMEAYFESVGESIPEAANPAKDIDPTDDLPVHNFDTENVCTAISEFTELLTNFAQTLTQAVKTTMHAAEVIKDANQKINAQKKVTSIRKTSL